MDPVITPYDFLPDVRKNSRRGHQLMRPRTDSVFPRHIYHPDNDSIDERKIAEKKQNNEQQNQTITESFFCEENENSAVCKAQEDFKNLLISGEDSDIVIKVQKKEFSAHKAILRARSSVFKAMLGHEMIETESGVVTIHDCDSTTFPDFLTYIYTGSTRHITHKNVCDLYKTSDKYDLKELKDACVLFMKNRLSVSIFCDVVSLALVHNEKELMQAAVEFFCRNALEIVQKPNWLPFLSENLTTGNELFIKLLSNKTEVTTAVK